MLCICFFLRYAIDQLTRHSCSEMVNSCSSGSYGLAVTLSSVGGYMVVPSMAMDCMFSKLYSL